MAISEIVELARKVAEGDNKAFEELYDKKSRDLIFYAMSILGDYQEAENVAQDAILAVYKNIGQLRDPKAIESWMFRILKNKCYRVIKKNERYKEEADMEDKVASIADNDDELLPENHVATSELDSQLYQIILGLPQKKREAVLLYYYDGMSYKEIAERQETSVDTVSSNLSRARAMIKNELEQEVYLQGIKKMHTTFE